MKEKMEENENNFEDILFEKETKIKDLKEINKIKENNIEDILKVEKLKSIKLFEK